MTKQIQMTHQFHYSDDNLCSQILIMVLKINYDQIQAIRIQSKKKNLTNIK